MDGWSCFQPCAMTATLMLLGGGEVDGCLSVAVSVQFRSDEWEAVSVSHPHYSCI